MIIISHRGYWKELAERNRPVAFHRSFDLGFGTETDIRDRDGKIVISHDMADASAISLDDLLDILGNRDLPLAVNVKADGLASALSEQMSQRKVTNWFTFDMSVPETIVQLRIGLPVFTRASEFEQPPACYGEAQGVWLDAFNTTWFGAAEIEGFLRDGKTVCIVSSELHRRRHEPLWTMLRNAPVHKHPKLMLCTDVPEEAVAFFGPMA